MEIFTKDSALRKGLKNAREQLKSFGAFSRKMGMGLAVSGMALMAPVVAAIPIYASFADQMSAVRAVTQANEEDFAALNQVAKDLGSSTSFSASQVAEGMKYLGMAGFETKEIIAGIPEVLNLARAGALELGVAADIASDVSSAFSLAAGDIGRVSDVIAKTATSANTTVEMMGETFKYVAPVAYAAGQSLEEMSAAIGLLGNNMVKASTAGTDMKEILATLAADQKKINELGVAVSDSAGNIRPVLDIMQDLGRATQDMRPDERLAKFMDIFGKRAGKSALILSRLNVGVDKMRGKMQDAAGAAAAMAEVMDDNLGGSWRMFMSAVEGVAIAIVEDMETPLRDILSVLSKLTAGATKWIAANKGIVGTVALVASGLIAAGGAFLAVGLSATLASLAIGGFVSVLSAAGTVLGILTSPFVLITAAVLGGAAALLYYSGIGGKMVSYLKEQFSGLGDIAGDVFTGIKDAMLAGDFERAGNILWKTLELVYLTGMNAINTKLSEWKTFFLNIWYGAIDQASNYFTDAWSGLQTTWTGITQFFGDAWDIVMNRIQKIWSQVGGRIIDGIDGIMDYVKLIHPSLKSILPESGQFRFEAKQATGVGMSSEEIDQATSNSIANRAQAARDQRNQIEQSRQGARGSINDMSQQRQSDRERKLEQSQKKASDAMTQTQAELRQLLQQTNQQAAQEKETRQEKAASAAAAASAALAPGGAVAKAGQSVSGSGNLKTKEGLETLAKLINMSGEDSVQNDQLTTLKRIYSAIQNGQQVKVVRSG